MTGKLAGKVALITGGARGQGRSHAVTLAGEGADVVVCDVAGQIEGVGYQLGTEAELADTVSAVEALGRRCIGVRADVRALSDMEKVAEQAIGELGRIDILVANAGIFGSSPVAEMSADQWASVIDVNLTGVFNSFRAVVPHMIERESGRIVAISSIVAKMGATNAGHYAAAKWGVIGLVKTLALEVMSKGITVNAVLPSGVNTAMIHNPLAYKALLPDLESPTRADADAMFAKSKLPQGLLEPAEVSDAILFLVSESGRHMTGETITLSAGMSPNTN